jgi:hypothetical protein
MKKFFDCLREEAKKEQDVKIRLLENSGSASEVPGERFVKQNGANVIDATPLHLHTILTMTASLKKPKLPLVSYKWFNGFCLGI